MPLRLVLDTDVVLSALLFTRGRLARLRRGWQTGHFTPLIGKPLAEELLRALSHPKFGLTPADRNDLLADYLPWCETVAVPEGPEAPDRRDPRDPDVAMLPQVARAGRADAMVSDDPDLLARAPAFQIPVLSPGDVSTRLTRPYKRRKALP